MTPLDNGNGEAAPRVLWVLHGAFIVAIPIYGYMTATVLAAHHGWQLGGIPQGTMFGVSLSLAAIQAAAGFMLLDRIFDPLALKTDDAMDFIQLMTRRVIIADACFEATAVYGVVMRVFGGDLWRTYALQGIALALLLAHSARVAGWIEEYHQRRRRGR